MNDPRATTLISAADLSARIAASHSLVVLDISADLAAAPLDRDVIPGAIAVGLAGDIAGPSSKEGGNRPLPDIATLQAKVRSWGVNDDTLVVVYDNLSGSQASRAWWTLRWAGHKNVRLLDGGFKAWQAASMATTATPAVAPGGGTATLSAGNMPVIDADQSADIAQTGVLIDSRGAAAFVGEADKPNTGHIPGAISSPSAVNIGPDGLFKSTEELKAGFAALGADGSKPLGVYCGSGIAAAHTIAAMHAAGLDAPLYVGSWSAWSADPARPVEQGEG
jgi:thiosulfate/3-mercaptopyruvate sulfurtransferase